MTARAPAVLTKTRCSSEAALSWLVENMQIQQQWPERPGTVGTKTSDDNCFGSELENENGKSPFFVQKDPVELFSSVGVKSQVFCKQFKLL